MWMKITIGGFIHLPPSHLLRNKVLELHTCSRQNHYKEYRMIYKGEKYIYIGFIKKPHGKKGKVILVPKRRFDPKSILRVFVKKDSDNLEEFRLKLAKEYKGSYILKLSKLKSFSDATELISKDVYIKEEDLPRKVKIDMEILPKFIEEVQSIPEDVVQVGFITRPRGLQGQVGALIEPDKFTRLKKNSDVYLMTPDGRFYKSKIRSLKKIKEGNGIYASIKLLYINDVESAERLRKAVIFI